MYRTLFVFIFASITFFQLSAQNQFKKGSLDISAGVGLFSTFAADNGIQKVPPLSLRLNYRIADQFSLGLYSAYSVTKTDLTINPDGSSSQSESKFTLLGLRGAAHIRGLDKWDAYGGFMIGYNMPNVKNDVTYPDTPVSGDKTIIRPTFTRPAENSVSYSAFVGGSYQFSKNIGAFGEVGYGISLLNVGVRLKII